MGHTFLSTVNLEKKNHPVNWEQFSRWVFQTHTDTNTHPRMEEESLQGRLSYLLSHFSYHLGFVNSQWGGNAISGAAHSSLRSLKKKKNRKTHQPFMTERLPHEVTPRGKPTYYYVLSTSTYDRCWVFVCFFFTWWSRCWGSIQIIGLCMLSGTLQSIGRHRDGPVKDWFSHWPCVIES